MISIEKALEVFKIKQDSLVDNLRNTVVRTRIRETDVAWFAGLYEGEGSISGKSLTMSQKDPWIFDRIVLLFGGSVYKPSTGHVAYQWRANVLLTKFLVPIIIKYLSPRRIEQLRKAGLIE